MPRAIKPKFRWRAGALVPPSAKLTQKHFLALAEAAGLAPADPEDRAKLREMTHGVADAIAIYRADRDRATTAPRPIHQRAALGRLDAAIDECIESFNALDDFSIGRLTAPRKRRTFRGGKTPDSPAMASRRSRLDATLGYRTGTDPQTALETLRDWSLTVTLALHDVDGQESRGRSTNASKRLLVSLLLDAFVKVTEAGESDAVMFLQAGCQAAGETLSERDAQTYAAKLVRVNTP